MRTTVYVVFSIIQFQII